MPFCLKSSVGLFVGCFAASHLYVLEFQLQRQIANTFLVCEDATSHLNVL